MHLCGRFPAGKQGIKTLQARALVTQTAACRRVLCQRIPQALHLCHRGREFCHPTLRPAVELKEGQHLQECKSGEECKFDVGLLDAYNGCTQSMAVTSSDAGCWMPNNCCKWLCVTNWGTRSKCGVLCAYHPNTRRHAYKGAEKTSKLFACPTEKFEQCNYNGQDLKAVCGCGDVVPYLHDVKTQEA